MGTKTERGQASAEFLAGLGALVLLLPSVLVVAALAFTHLWIEYQLEQAAICLTDPVHKPSCQKRLDRAVRAFVPWGHWQSQAPPTGFPTTVTAKYQLGDWRWQWKKHLNLESVARAASRRPR